ncbi:MAG: hybrid sensor histidine kinase/response regulator [Planctomycetota bacterium]
MSGLRVASVDDNPHDSALLESRLRRLATEELSFSAFADPTTAIDAIAGSELDLIFVDDQVGDLTGFDLLQQLQARGVQAPAVLMAGRVDVETAARAVREGFAGFLLKSKTGEESLSRTIEVARQVADQRRAMRQAEALIEKQALEIESFYHSISHELNTPLTSCREFTSIVLDEIAGPISKEQREYLEIVDQGQRRIASIVTDLMDSTLLGAQQIELRREECCVLELLAEVVERHRDAAREKEITVGLTVDPGLPRVALDPARWSDAMGRLVDNAILYSTEGSAVEVSAQRCGDTLRVSVQDEGIGIDPDQCEIAFDRLVQLSKDDPALSPGLGLGLFIAKEIASLHGGEILLDSELGKGSAFVLTLPLSPKQEQQAMPKVLVVDDDAKITKALQIRLQEEGFEVVMGHDGVSGMKIAVSEKPDLIILDISMPAGNGLSLARKLSDNDITMTIPVVFMTASKDPALREGAEQVGAIDFLEKPFDFSEVKRVAQRVLGLASS